MKILFVTPSHVVPPKRGYQVMQNELIKILSKDNNIDVLTFSSQRTSNDFFLVQSSRTYECHYIYLSKIQMLINLIRCFFSQTPFQVGIYESRQMHMKIDELLISRGYDVVIFQLSRMANFLPSWYKKPVILNMIDPLVLNYKRSITWRPWYQRILLKTEINRLLNFEKKIVKKFNKVLLISRNDILDYKEVLNINNIQEAPYGVDTNYFKSQRDLEERVRGRIVITGNMSFSPNIDAVNFFCKEVFPLVLSMESNAHLYIVGSNPSSEVLKLASEEKIIVTGTVDDMRDFIGSALVSVCPVRLAVGVQTKVLEAMAMGTPVVTTTAGNKGISAVNGECLYVADDPQEMANHIISLLRLQNWQKLSTLGRLYVENEFAWENSAKKFESVMMSVA